MSQDGNGERIPVRMTQAELGLLLGASGESLNKQLNGFARKSWVPLACGTITVLDAAALRYIAS